MSSAPAIGIDLGTTFSGAAVYRDGKSEMIPNKEGHHLTPSFVFYSPRNLNVSVGTTADDMGVKNIENFLFDMKRIIGRKYDDVYVQGLKKSQEYRFNIVRGENDVAEIELLHDGLLVHKTPEEASSEILKYLRESANEYLGVNVSEAVISIPAYFSNAQRKATRAAAELAGFKVLKLVTEPVAAAIHYAQKKLETEGTLLVVDFGGGTLDVSIIEADKKSFKVKSVEGDTFLGGRDFDQILLQHFKSKIISKFGPGIFTDRLLRRVKEACIRLKIKLSTEQEYSVTLNCIGGNENSDYTLTMTRAEFEQLNDDLFRRLLYLVEKCLNEAGMAKSDIDEVVLVGGTTRIPKTRKMLTSYFDNKTLKTDVNPDEAVAHGAAIQAAMIKEKCKDLEKYKVTEVTPLSLGLNYDGGIMKVFIKKNSSLPFKSLALQSVTVENNQTGAVFQIYEGERKMCKYNNFLGSFHLNDLPPGKAGTIKCKSIFSLNEDGILEVEAYEISTQKKNKIAVTIGEYRLCDYKIKNIIQDADQNKEEDEKFETFVEYRSNVQAICNHILYDLNNIPIVTDREFVEEKCRELKRYTKSLEFTKIDELQEQYKAFKRAIEGIIDQYINVKLDIDDASLKTIFELFSTMLNLTTDVSNNSDSLVPRRKRKSKKVPKV